MARACVEQVAYYACKAWYQVSKQQARQVTAVEKAVVAAARAVVPHYRSTPLVAIHRESGILPVKLELGRRGAALGRRLAGADARHPLLPRARLPAPKAGAIALQRTWAEALRLPARVLLHPRADVPYAQSWPSREEQLREV